MSQSLPLVVAALPVFKRESPDTTVILGGLGPSPIAGPLLEAFDEIDVVVVGEGEATIVDAVRRLTRREELSGVPGVAYRAGSRVVTNRIRSRIGDLSALPHAAYDSVALPDYDIVDVQLGRGCPHRCRFCSAAPFWGHRYTHRSVKDLLDELEALAERHDVRRVFFIDDTFTLCRDRVEEVCSGLAERRLNLLWGCYARADQIDERLLDRMVDAGCRKVLLGIETGSEAVLADLGKGTTLRRMTEAVRAAIARLDYVSVTMMWGLPRETFADLEATAHYMIYLASLGACPQLNVVVPYPNTHLYQVHGHEVRFRPDFSQQLALYRGERNWLKTLIGRRPDLFSSFCVLPTPELERKWERLCDIGLSPYELQDAYYGISDSAA